MGITKGCRVMPIGCRKWYKVARVGSINGRFYVTLHNYIGVLWSDEIKEVREA